MYYESLRMDMMINIMTQGNEAQSQDEAIKTMVVGMCKLSDKVFFEKGLDTDELEAAAHKFNIMEDPKIKSFMMNMQMKMAREMQRMGGMGGMGGGMMM
jgi:hypothetical protein